MMVSAHHARALARAPVPVPKVGIVKYRGALWYAQRDARTGRVRLLQRVPQRKPAVRRVSATARSGSDLAGALKSPVGKAIEGIIPGGSAIASVVEALAPLLDTSLQSVQCAPGNANYPACLTPGGSAQALTQSIGNADVGLKPAIAAQIVAEAQAAGGLGGGGRTQGLESPTLRER